MFNISGAMVRRLSWTLAVAGLIAVAFGASITVPREAKKTVAIYTYVSYPILDQSIVGIKQGLANAGYTSDNLRYVEVNANGQQNLLGAFTKEVLATHPDVIIPVSTPVTQSVVNLAAPAQAIVFSTVTNPSDVGMDDRPENVTGVSDAVNYSANMDLIREIVPNAKTIGIIYNAGERNSQYGVEKVKEIASRKGLRLKLVSIASTSEIADATKSVIGLVDVIYVGSDNTVVSGLDALLAVTGQHKIPVIASDEGSVAKGALAAVSVDYVALGERAGEIAATVLRSGEAPGKIPNVIFEGNSLVLNKEAARRLDIELPPELVATASKIVGEE